MEINLNLRDILFMFKVNSYLNKFYRNNSSNIKEEESKINEKHAKDFDMITLRLTVYKGIFSIDKKTSVYFEEEEIFIIKYWIMIYSRNNSQTFSDVLAIENIEKELERVFDDN